MGNLIGSIVPAVDEEINKDDVDIKDQVRKQRAWNAELYAEVIDPLGENGEFAEVDVAVVVDENHVVIAYKTLRVSVDEPEDHGMLFGDPEQPFADWVREVAVWAQSVEGHRMWYWFHIHPEGMPMPSQSDERKVEIITQASLIVSGHVGAPREFQALAVTQRAGIIALQSEGASHVSPKTDAMAFRVYANTYARVLGDDHPLTVAQDAVATALEGFVAEGDSANPFAMMMFVMTGGLAEKEQALAEARDEFASPEQDAWFRQALKDDYIRWLAEGKPGHEITHTNTSNPVERLILPEEQSIELPTFLLDALGGFDFTGLDPQ